MVYNPKGARSGERIPDITRTGWAGRTFVISAGQLSPDERLEISAYYYDSHSDSDGDPGSDVGTIDFSIVSVDEERCIISPIITLSQGSTKTGALQRSRPDQLR